MAQPCAPQPTVEASTAFPAFAPLPSCLIEHTTSSTPRISYLLFLLHRGLHLHLTSVSPSLVFLSIFFALSKLACMVTHLACPLTTIEGPATESSQLVQRMTYPLPFWTCRKERFFLSGVAAMEGYRGQGSEVPANLPESRAESQGQRLRRDEVETIGLCWRAGSVSICTYTQGSAYVCVHTRGSLFGGI